MCCALRGRALVEREEGVWVSDWKGVASIKFYMCQFLSFYQLLVYEPSTNLIN